MAAKINSFLTDYGVPIRVVLGFLAALGALAALLDSTFSEIAFQTFNGWPVQNLRDFSVLMVSYALLCIVKQPHKPFFFDALAFVVSFILWVAALVYSIFQGASSASDLISLLAVFSVIAFAILGPIWKGDTHFIWHKAPPVV
ncbi:hypothetical protein RCH16_003149 [Cryobacterium sp. MP_M5]|uniref:hypothetical protein n=1 Tax=unclassified Cryobacterium TaxID=2649013 RepID=UPI0018CADEE9|nr:MULTISPECIES: hypothetical protein [unclassified Cryobacterium]MBG6059803.1 hypothetical protein [Cryobacterium sp. MP_M3]MEC5178118.1 hypothetical protein [Cryobacterium sp. MP_M5]